MKKILSLILYATMMVGNSFAQSHLVATLDHEGTVSVFTGADAFINAHEAAVDGDIITLSSGAFNSKMTITKAILLFGAGMQPYESSSRLIDSINIAIPLTTPKKLYIEGIRFGYTTTEDLNKAMFKKCTFEENFNYFGNKQGSDFVGCRFDESFINKAGLAILSNCAVDCLYNVKNDTTSYVCTNSYLYLDAPEMDDDDYSQQPYNVYHSVFTNCIIGAENQDYLGWGGEYIYQFKFDDSISLFSCLINISGYQFARGPMIDITIDRSSLTYFSDFSKIFKTFKNDFNNHNETFELTDEAKTTYLGNDGTEVGLYGGAMPYNPTPSVPKIKEFRMDAKPSEGILKADVEVE